MLKWHTTEPLAQPSSCIIVSLLCSVTWQLTVTAWHQQARQLSVVLVCTSAGWGTSLLPLWGYVRNDHCYSSLRLMHELA